MPIPFFQRNKSLEELQEENEQLKVQADNEGLQLTIAQKRDAVRRLKEAGLTTKSFGGSWVAIKNWLKNH